MTRHLRDLPRAQLAVDVTREFVGLLLQAIDLFGDVHCRIVLDEAQLLDTRLQFGDGLLKVEESRFHVGLLGSARQAVPPTVSPSMRRVG